MPPAKNRHVDERGRPLDRDAMAEAVAAAALGGAPSEVAGPAAGPIDPDYDYTTFPEAVASASDAYAQAGIKDPRAVMAMAEVHDCFTPIELVLMEDLGSAPRVCSKSDWRLA